MAGSYMELGHPRSSEAGTTSPVNLSGHKISPILMLRFLLILVAIRSFGSFVKIFGLPPFLPLAFAVVRPD